MQLVTIFGGSGFVGRYIAEKMAQAGWRVRVAVRRPNEAHFVRTYGVVGQVEPVFCNIRDDDSVRSVLRGVDSVVNCVGILAETGKNTFEAIQDEGAARIARIAAEEGARSLVQLSAIGADRDAQSDYARTKGLGEDAVRSHFPAAVILRPSIVFGPEDEFFNRFAAMTRLSPMVPLFGADTRFQPVYVDDVAEAAALAAQGKADAGIYELGGPDISTFRELMDVMLDVIRRRRLVVGFPAWLGKLMATVFGVLSKITFGIVKPPVTKDQIIQLNHDNVVADDARTLSDLGIQPTSMEAVLPSYLWMYRPDGQYSDITRSAKNLRS